MNHGIEGLDIKDAHSEFCVAWGAGVDSTAMLVRMVKIGLRPSLITFADTGAERPDTYAFIPIFSAWLVSKGFPKPVVCRYEPQPATSKRYRDAVVKAAKDLKISLTDIEVKRLSGIYGNMIANDTLPSIAFRRNKSCSVKYKLQAQEPT